VSDGRRVALVLGSGGARGYAHVGVIEVLEARGYEIVAVAGSSMGAMVGGVWAAGRLPEYREWVTGLGQFEILRLLDLALASAGAIRGDKVFGRVRELVGDLQIEDLPVPFTAVATDLMARREVWFQRGPLDLAMRASAAMPSLLPPVDWRGRVLVDGGVLNPLPLAPTASAHADLVVAVSLHGDVPRGLDPVPPETEEPAEALVERIRNRASRLVDREGRTSLWSRINRDVAVTESAVLPASPLLAQAVAVPDDDEAALDGTAAALVDAGIEPVSDDRKLAGWRRQGAKVPRPASRALSKFDVVNLSIDTMQAALTRHRLAGYPPDVLVSVSKQACRTLDFHRAEEMIALGRWLTERALDAYTEPPPSAATVAASASSAASAPGRPEATSA
jgi:NTE family protein